MNYIKTLLAICCITIAADASAQQATTAETIPNTVMVKFLPSTVAVIKGARVAASPLEKIFENAAITSMKQVFANATAQNCLPKNIGNPKNIDLSTIYEIKYEGNTSILEIIALLRKSGLVAYAEPKYLDKILYTPNDPEAQPKTGKQYQLAVIKAYEAWEIEKGDSNVVIGIVDTDQNINHPDLAGRTKINTKDPINGKDDDGDGEIDNYRGWDIANKDNDVTAKQAIVLNTTTTKNDTLNGNGHGTLVYGFAGASTNNGIGIAGISFNSKILPVKAMRDEDAKTGGISSGYEGLIYAAEHGVKVINCSWGSFSSYQRIAQEAINYATFNFDVLVVAAAGNENAEKLLYPCSYDNVLCVAASDVNDKGEDVKAGFATYSHLVDISAPGERMYGPYKNDYIETNGSSHSAPTVSGAAALVRSHFPNYNALQTLEQLRITADNMDNLAANSAYKEKLGKGRLNVFRAVTEKNSPAVRLYESNMPNAESNIKYAGSTIEMTGYFRNYLAPTANLKITLRCLSPFIEMIDSTITLGKINTLDSATHANNPFRFKVKSNTPVNHTAEFRIGYSDGAYNDYQYINGFFNPNFVTLDTNQIKLTITSNGRLGFRDAEGYEGLGLIYKNKSLLFESGLIITTPQKKISDCVRSLPKGNSDVSFVASRFATMVSNGFAGQEVYTELNDTNTTKVGVNIKQNSYASPLAPNDKYAIIRYYITNTSGATIDSMRVGIYTDWDIMTSNRNRADYDASSNLAYTFSTATGGLYAGVSLLSGEPISVFSHDHNTNLVGNINPNDGFSDDEKNIALSKGVARAKAGTASLGADVSQTIGGVILNIKNNEIRQIAFAILAGDTKADIIASALAAKSLYNNMIKPTEVAENETAQNINIYPNPASETLTISFPQIANAVNIQIENMVGSEIWSGAMNNQVQQINITAFSPGVYFVKINTAKGMVVKKFVKE